MLYTCTTKQEMRIYKYVQTYVITEKIFD